jgi:hypothetical protein
MLTEKQIEAFNKTKKYLLKDIKIHMKQHAWPLNYTYYLTELVGSVIPVNLLNEAFEEIQNTKGLAVWAGIGEDGEVTGLFIKKNEKKGNVYYREDTNELEIFNTKDYPDPAIWTYIGKF